MLNTYKSQVTYTSTLLPVAAGSRYCWEPCKCASVGRRRWAHHRDLVCLQHWAAGAGWDTSGNKAAFHGPLSQMQAFRALPVSQIDPLCRRVWAPGVLRYYFVNYSDERGSAGEFAVFHIMSRILEAANGMCMPLPPGKFCILLF